MMKVELKQLCAALLVLITCHMSLVTCGAGNAVIVLTDFQSNPLPGEQAVLTFLSAPQSQYSGTAVSWRNMFTADGAGTIYLTNASPGKWQVTPVDDNAVSFTFNMPVTNGTIYVQYWTTAAAGNTLPPGTMSYDVNASDLRYLQAAGTISNAFAVVGPQAGAIANAVTNNQLSVSFGGATVTGMMLVSNVGNAATLTLAGNTATGGATRTISGSPSGIIMEGMQVAAGVVSAGSFNGSAAGLTGLSIAGLPHTVATNFNVIDFGATGGADDTVAFQNALNAAASAGGGRVVVPGMILFTVQPLKIPSKVFFGGDNGFTYVNMKQGAIGFCLDTAFSTNWGIMNLVLDGGARSVDGSGFTSSYAWPNVETETSPWYNGNHRTGIDIWTVGQQFVSNVRCIGFTNGFYFFSTNFQAIINGHPSASPMVQIENCYASQCYQGWNIGSFTSPTNGVGWQLPVVSGSTGNFPEYIHLKNSGADSCAYGARVDAGNVIWAGGSLSENQFNLTMQQGHNVGHGAFIGVRFNHPNQYAVWLDHQTIGETFSACDFLGAQSSMPNIKLTGCAGVDFDGCEFDGSSASPLTTISSSTNDSTGQFSISGVNRIWNSMYRGVAANFTIVNDGSLSISMDSLDHTNDYIRNNIPFVTASGGNLTNLNPNALTGTGTAPLSAMPTSLAPTNWAIISRRWLDAPAFGLPNVTPSPVTNYFQAKTNGLFTISLTEGKITNTVSGNYDIRFGVGCLATGAGEQNLELLTNGGLTGAGTGEYIGGTAPTGEAIGEWVGFLPANTAISLTAISMNTAVSNYWLFPKQQ